MASFGAPGSLTGASFALGLLFASVAIRGIEAVLGRYSGLGQQGRHHQREGLGELPLAATCLWVAVWQGRKRLHPFARQRGRLTPLGRRQIRGMAPICRIEAERRTLGVRVVAPQLPAERACGR